jgi:hypothetical protein
MQIWIEKLLFDSFICVIKTENSFLQRGIFVVVQIIQQV